MKFHGKLASLQQVNSPNSQDIFQICCGDMYLVRFLANFAGFHVFLWISRDFTDLLEIRGSTTARNIRSPGKRFTEFKWKISVLTYCTCKLENVYCRSTSEKRTVCLLLLFLFILFSLNVFIFPGGVLPYMSYIYKYVLLSRVWFSSSLLQHRVYK